MRLLLDTNVLCRLVAMDHAQHAVAARATRKLSEAAHPLCVAPHVRYEYWVVAARPLAQNGLGMVPNVANEAIDRRLTQLRLLQDERAVFERWRQLVRTHGVASKSSHDARLVAAMLRHDVNTLILW